MADFEKDLWGLLRALAENDVKFVVCGGVACVLHGVERSTYDIDLSVSFETANLKRLIEVTKTFGLVPRIPEPAENLLDEKVRNSWIQDKGALVYTFVSNNSPLQLDIFLDYPRTFDELYENADKLRIENFEFLISSKEDLIFAKNLVNPMREKDLIDIDSLNRISNEKKED